MQESFENNLHRLVPDAANKKFLLAVSGGADSSVMAYLFHSAKLQFAIAHCNFHLRGDDANKDMMLVRKMATDFNVLYFENEFDTLEIQYNSGKSIEIVARELRYHWFREICKEHNFDYIVTAHNANDNVETFLLNTCRGTGIKGLCGIPECAHGILRPMLIFSSKEIRLFAQNQQIEYRNDQSNFSEIYQRNKIRLSVIPKLEEINPEFISTFCRNNRLLNAQNNFYRNQIQNIINQIIKKENERILISIEQLNSFQDNELIFYEILLPYGFSPKMIQQIWNNRNQDSGKKFYSEKHYLIKDRQFYILSKTEENIIDNQVFKDEKDLEKLQEFGFKIEKKTVEGPISFEKDNHLCYVDAQKLKFPLTLRTWKEGDFFYPLGMKGKQKLSDFFNNRKIDIINKRKIKILCSGEEIVWLVGFRSDERYKIDKNTEYYYKITYYESL